MDAIDAQRFASTLLRRSGDARYLSYFDWDDDGRVALIDSLTLAVSALVPQN